MKKVINTKKFTTVPELVEQLQSGAKLVVYYMARTAVDSESYPVFFKKTSSGNNMDVYGFVAPIFTTDATYAAFTIRDSLQKALDGGKELIVLERNEVNQLFKKIS